MHFNRVSLQRGGPPWSVHWRGRCYIVDVVECNVPMKSVWRPTKKCNPRAFFTAQVRQLEVVDGVAVLR